MASGIRGIVVLGLAAAAGVFATFTVAQIAPVFGEREVLQQPLVGMTSEEMERFKRGRSLFNQSWVIAPSSETDIDGLGPIYNRVACSSCHARNGQGGAPDQSDQRMASMLVRLSVWGQGPHGGPNPHPVYGDQFNEEGVPGVRGEGRANLLWHYSFVTLKDGTRVQLRKPSIRFSDLGYGPLGNVLTSARVSPSVAGMGLLEAVPDSYLEEIASETKADGVRGKVNMVWDAGLGRIAAGRLGLKSNVPNVYQQTAGAFSGDMGLTTHMFPHGNCTRAQGDCLNAANGGTPEITDIQMDDLVFYLRHLAPPPRRYVDDPMVETGEQLFASSGCTSCHRPTMRTGTQPGSPALSNREFSPYTDLLVHDMGPELADGRPDFAANGREWRTAPLWGLGYLEAINPDVRYLHDGRARTLEEAILWHGGEAKAARKRYSALSDADRRALLAFLKSL